MNQHIRLDGLYVGPISPDDILHYKALPPLSDQTKDAIAKIENVDISNFNETEVRAFIIDPLVKALGYDKGTSFSMDLGKSLEFLGTHKFFDYSFLLWEEHFWLIEAKRPIFNSDSFEYEVLAQALEYAVHPKINAALVVLCDGIKLEIFDREVDITKPILRVKISELLKNYDKIRSVLEPLQVWFFQKRRVVRLLDKVFDKEFNMQRVEEFRSLIGRSLDSKRSTIMNNFRSAVKNDPHSDIPLIQSATLQDLIEAYIFLPQTVKSHECIIDAMVKYWEKDKFRITYGLFPDDPRDHNDWSTANSAAFLIVLSEKHESMPFLPSWIRQSKEPEESISDAARRMLSLCLTHFESDEPRKIVLLASCTLRRIRKLLAQISEKHWALGQTRHLLQRFLAPEISWKQIISSPEHHNLDLIDVESVEGTRRFVKDCSPKDKGFQIEVAKLRLKELWRSELELLAGIENYSKLRQERDIGEIHPTEANCVVYDFLGHITLCLIERFPEWKKYALQYHRNEIQKISAMGSFKATSMLKEDGINEKLPMTDFEMASRFFLGDTATMLALRKAYFNV